MQFIIILLVVMLCQLYYCAEYGYYSSTELGEQPSWFAPPSGYNNYNNRFDNNRHRSQKRRSTTRKPDNEMPWKTGDRVNLAGIPGLMNRPKYQPPTPPTPVPKCLCKSTPEYNPVCASNNQTFSNPGLLQCAWRCGQPLVLLHYGVCRT